MEEQLSVWERAGVVGPGGGRCGVGSEWRNCRGTRSVARTGEGACLNWCFEMLHVGTCLSGFMTSPLTGNRAGPWHLRGGCDSQHEGMPRICSGCRTSYFQGLHQQPGRCFEGPAT